MNRGAVVLAEKLKQRDGASDRDRGAVRSLAIELGVEHSLVSRWQHSVQRPDTQNRVKLFEHQEFKIPILSWDDELPEQEPTGAA
jgi:transcriptional regulator with XRE-family HTH domain